MQHLTIIALAIYLGLALTTTYFLGQSLFQNGKAYVAACLPNHPHWHHAVNTFLLLGFYLINLSFILFYLFWGDLHITSYHEAFEFCALKLGKTYLILAAMHFHNIIGLTFYPKFIKQNSHGNT